MALVRRRVSRFATGSRTRRRSIWAYVNGLLVISPGVTSVSNLLTSAETLLGAQFVGSTIVRNHGHVTPRILGAATNIWTVAIGVFPETMTAATLDPNVNPHLDWMYINSEEQDATASDRAAHSPNRMEWDLKSKRKLDEIGERLTMVVYTQNQQTFYFSNRALILLP